MVLINQQPYLAQDIWLGQKPAINEDQREQNPIERNFSNHIFMLLDRYPVYLKLPLII